MPSQSNPNVPTSLKPKSARTLKNRRQRTQRLARRRANGTTTPRTSQAIRKAAPISNKKARKLETKKLHAKTRALEEKIQTGEVEMKDVDVGKETQRRIGRSKVLNAEKGEEMAIDQGTG